MTGQTEIGPSSSVVIVIISSRTARVAGIDQEVGYVWSICLAN